MKNDQLPITKNQSSITKGRDGGFDPEERTLEFAKSTADALGKKDFLHRIKICRKEAKESQYWFELIKELNPDCAERINALLNEAIELKKIFSSSADKCSSRRSVIGY